MRERSGRRERNRWAGAVLAAAMVLALAGAGVGAAAPVQGGTLTIGLDVDPTTLDPHQSAAAASYLVGSLNINESLLFQDATGKLIPWLATRYTVSPDGRTFTFDLAQNVTFSDGAPFDAEAVKYNFDRIVNPNFRSGGSINALVGYIGTTVVDPHTVRISFKDAYAPFLSYLAAGGLGMVSPKTTATQTPAQTSLKPVGTGAFIASEYAAADHITMARNPAFNRREPWSDHQGPAYLDRVIWKIVPESMTRSITLSSGETQMIYILGYGTTTGSILSQLQKNPQVKVDSHPFPGSAYLWLINVRKPPTDDVRVRQAVLYGINRRAIIAAIYRGLGQPACGYVSHVLLQDPAACSRYPYDAQKAGQLLDEAGWKMGPNRVREKNGQPLQVVINSLNSGGGDLPDIQPVQGQLMELGFDAKIKSQAFGARTQDNFTCADNFGTIFLRANDPDTLSALFDSRNIGSNFNWSCYSDPDVDRMLAEGRSTLDPAKRRALYLDLQRILMDRAVAMPMMDELAVWVLRTNVQGVKYNYLVYPAFTDAYLTK
jgi:peptide/nickel transport system substrate-binding protein